MKHLLYITGTLSGLYGLGILSVAETALHEIEAFILFAVCAVCIGCGAIVGAVNSLEVE